MLYNKKLMSIEYEYLEDAASRNILDRAKQVMTDNRGAYLRLPSNSTLLFSNLLKFVLYSATIAVLHPAMIVALIVLAALDCWIVTYMRKYVESKQKARAKLVGKLAYMCRIMRDSSGTKEICLYNMQQWFVDIVNMLTHQKQNLASSVANRSMAMQWLSGVLIMLRDAMAFGVLIYLYSKKMITLGVFVYALSVVANLAQWISSIIAQIGEVQRGANEANCVRDYMNLSDTQDKGTCLPATMRQPSEISFDNVSYCYKGSSEWALNSVSMTIHKGERVAIVGSNGAGKTTFIKLLCGLYTPTCGTIRINGADIGSFDRKEYYSLISAVFQDIHVLTGSILVNVSQQPTDGTDEALVVKALQRAGLYDKVASLPMDVNTLLVSKVHENAVDLSGGEMQKLAMARAIYKNGVLLVLDEPTAALDAIAEKDIYEQYASITEGKTSIFVSHRLASTRFCDRIFLFDKGRIVETGTHDELMKLGGAYSAMFQVQSSYYVS